MPLSFSAPFLVVFCAHLTPPLDSHMLSCLRCAHFGTFAALKRCTRAFHISVCSGGTVGIASFCSFQYCPGPLERMGFGFGTRALFM
jgi:hypothetical protein